MNRKRFSDASGNVLFLILIAVVLFGALSYAISRGTRSGEGGMTKENVKIKASQIVQYGTYMASSVQRMFQLGMPATDFCFDADGWGHDDYDHAACSRPQTHVYSAGGVSWSKPVPGINDGSDWYIPANVCVAGVGVYGGDDCDNDNSGDSEDLVLILPNITRDTCLELNNRLGIENTDGEPPKAGGSLFDSGMSKFEGTYADGTVINSNGSNPATLRRQSYGCVESGGPTPPEGTYHYFHVLLAR